MARRRNGGIGVKLKALLTKLFRPAEESAKTKIRIERILDYADPYFDGRSLQGSLIVSEGDDTQICKIKNDVDGEQYITFNGKRLYVENMGSLYSPKFVIIH